MGGCGGLGNSDLEDTSDDYSGGGFGEDDKLAALSFLVDIDSLERDGRPVSLYGEVEDALAVPEGGGVSFREVNGAAVCARLGDGDIVSPRNGAGGGFAEAVRLIHGLVLGLGAANNRVLLLEWIGIRHANQPAILVAHEPPNARAAHVDVEIRRR